MEGERAASGERPDLGDFAGLTERDANEVRNASAPGAPPDTILQIRSMLVKLSFFGDLRRSTLSW